MNTQTAALSAAQQLISLMAQFEQLSNNVDAFMKNYNQNTWDTFWSAMATVATNADGSPGTADGTPNTAHPISLTPPGASTPLYVSRSSLINGVTMIQKYQTFMSQAGGTLALSAQANVTTVYLVTG